MLRFELLCAWWLPGRGNGFLAAAERGDEIFWRKCGLTGTSRIKAAGIRQFVMNHARQPLMVALTDIVCCLSFLLQQAVVTAQQILSKGRRELKPALLMKSDVWNLPCK